MNNQATPASLMRPTLTVSGFSIYFIHYSGSLVSFCHWTNSRTAPGSWHLHYAMGKRFQMCPIFSNLINNWFLVSKTMNWPGKEHDIWNQRTTGSEDRQAWLTLPTTKPQATKTDQNFSFFINNENLSI